MLPSLGNLIRERTLLYEVLRAAHEENPNYKCPPEHGNGRTVQVESSKVGDPEAVNNIAGRMADRLEGETLQELPRELLVDIAEQFLESPVWHLCQLGETSEHLGKVFNDEALWQGFFETRFREAEKSPSRKRSSQRQARESSPPGARQMYAELHSLEMRFREGLYSARSTLSNPHKGVPVLDLRIAPGPVSTAAFAALRDGSIMVYDLDPENCCSSEAEQAACCDAHERSPAKPLQELTGPQGAGPALCCLPVELHPSNGRYQSDQSPPVTLFAGHALGRLAAWDVPSGCPIVVQPWEQAHSDRISALAAFGGEMLLSAGGDRLVKAWDLGTNRFGDARQTFAGHEAAVVSVAASPFGRETFLTGSHDRTMRLWDARQGSSSEVAVWRQQDWVTCVEFHPTSPHHIFGSDKSVHQWDLRMAGSSPMTSLHRHRKLISRFRVDPLRLASCSLDGCVKASSLEDPGVRHASPHASPASSPVHRPAPSPGTPQLGAAFAENMRDVCTLCSSADYVLCIDFNETRLLAGAVDGRVDAYDFSHLGNFRRTSSPLSSPLGTQCRQSVDFGDLELIELPEIAVR